MAAAAVPVLMKAAPLIASGVGSLLGKKLAKPSPAQQAATGATAQAGDQLGAMVPQLQQQGQAQSTAGAGYLNQAGGYYGKLLGGSRSAMQEATAPEMATILDQYKGAASKTARTMRGGSRDYALAELDRQKVGQQAMLPLLARQGAAAQVGQTGNALLSSGANLTGQSIYGASARANIGQQQYNQATNQSDREGAAGKSVGGFLHDIVSTIPWGKMGGGASKLGPLFSPKMPNLSSGVFGTRVGA